MKTRTKRYTYCRGVLFHELEFERTAAGCSTYRKK